MDIDDEDFWDEDHDPEDDVQEVHIVLVGEDELESTSMAFESFLLQPTETIRF
jgi:hypothetical protein